MTAIPDLGARMVNCILDNIPLNIGRFVVFDKKFKKNDGGTHLTENSENPMRR